MLQLKNKLDYAFTLLGSVAQSALNQNRYLREVLLKNEELIEAGKVNHADGIHTRGYRMN